jgi:protein tyrosine/serine phosphatase
VLALSLYFGLIAAACVAGTRGLPEKDGIGNFGQVDEVLYRGAQPDEVAIQSLKRLGVKTIVDLRTGTNMSKREAAAAQANGIVYTNVPFKGTSRPTDEQINRVLALIQTSAGPVFVHCQHGCDRTGTVIACYRIQHDGWSTEVALQEANQYGMSKLERGMRAYVIDFGKRAKPLEFKPKQVEATARFN